MGSITLKWQVSLTLDKYRPKFKSFQESLSLINPKIFTKIDPKLKTTSENNLIDKPWQKGYIKENEMQMQIGSHWESEKVNEIDINWIVNTDENYNMVGNWIIVNIEC